MNFSVSVWINGVCHTVEVRNGAVSTAPEALRKIRTLPYLHAREMLREMGATVRSASAKLPPEAP